MRLQVVYSWHAMFIMCCILQYKLLTDVGGIMCAGDKLIEWCAANMQHGKIKING